MELKRILAQRFSQILALSPSDSLCLCVCLLVRLSVSASHSLGLCVSKFVCVCSSLRHLSPCWSARLLAGESTNPVYANVGCTALLKKQRSLRQWRKTAYCLSSYINVSVFLNSVLHQHLVIRSHYQKRIYHNHNTLLFSTISNHIS